MPDIQHTPGPWHLAENKHCVIGQWTPPFEPTIEGTHQTAGIAMCAMARRVPEENAANARLIAAAPDLLVALQETIDAECSLRCPSVWETGTPQPHTDTCKRARAAIAKATKGQDEVQPES